MTKKVCFIYFAGWTDAKGLFIVYPSHEHAADTKKYLPRYNAWKAVEEVCTNSLTFLSVARYVLE